MTLMWIAIVVLAAWAAWVAYEINSPSGCSGDCYQGRQACNCEQTTPDTNPNWPFPTQTKP
jgi:hypothetical protein